MKLNWQQINNVILDMDGTLLDLGFDNFFWCELIPQVYAEKNQISFEQSQTLIFRKMRNVYGQIEWYCLDYWKQLLAIDIHQLKFECRHKISLRPNTLWFLEQLKQHNKQLILFTNAHSYSMNLKLEQTGIAHFFKHCISTHQFGVSKENQQCWYNLQQLVGFEKSESLFMDDSQMVLDSAVEFGIGYVLGISKPDLNKPVNVLNRIDVVEDFNQLVF